MIILTRLGGHELAVNPDLFERAEATPDTVITLVDGHKLVVAESLVEVIARVRAWRASVTAEAYLVASTGTAPEQVRHDAHAEQDSPSCDVEHLSAITQLGAHVLPLHRGED